METLFDRKKTKLGFHIYGSGSSLLRGFTFKDRDLCDLFELQPPNLKTLYLPDTYLFFSFFITPSLSYKSFVSLYLIHFLIFLIPRFFKDINRVSFVLFLPEFYWGVCKRWASIASRESKEGLVMYCSFDLKLVVSDSGLLKNETFSIFVQTCFWRLFTKFLLILLF
jgi:hypothetical protein